MNFSFKELPGAGGDYLRPTLAVTLEGLALAPQLCLLDTGSLHNRFAGWVAEAAGLDLEGVERQEIALGGFTTTARISSLLMTVGRTSWEAPVWFCDPWPLPFQLLGQEGFFRWFDVRFRTAHYEFDVEPEPEA